MRIFAQIGIIIFIIGGLFTGAAGIHYRFRTKKWLWFPAVLSYDKTEKTLFLIGAILITILGPLLIIIGT